MIDITTEIRGDKRVKAAVKILRKRMSNNAALRAIARPASKVIVDGLKAAQFQAEGARSNTPKKYHYSYRKGKRISQFTPGHLERSIREISTVKRAYVKFYTLYVGPVYTGKASKGGSFTGFGKDVDAYYAHMMLGGADAYEKKIINKGLRSVENIAGTILEKTATKIIENNAKKSGFKTR